MDDDEGKFRESIWSINPNWRGWFYGTLSICGFGVSIFTVWTLCGRDPSESWIDIFDAVWNGIVGSVVVVWFLFQAVDWVTPRAISLFNYIKKIMAWGDPYREAQIKEAEAQARKEERERIKKILELLQKENVHQDVIQQAQYISDSLKPPNYP